MGFLISLIFMLLEIFIWIMIVGIIMSWLIAFNVLNGNSGFVMKVYNLINRIVDPILAPIRRVIPPIGGIDITPIVVIIAVELLKQIIIRSLYF